MTEKILKEGWTQQQQFADGRLLLEFWKALVWELKSVFPLMTLAQKVCMLRKVSHLHKLKGHQGN